MYWPNNSPQRGPHPNSQKSVYTLFDMTKYFIDLTALRTLMWGGFSGLSTWASRRVRTSKDYMMIGSRKKGDDRSRGWNDIL